MQKLAGCQSCFWHIGRHPSRYPDEATMVNECTEFPFSAAKAFVKYLLPVMPIGQDFRFIYVCGGLKSWPGIKRVLEFRDDPEIYHRAGVLLITLGLELPDGSKFRVRVVRLPERMALTGTSGRPSLITKLAKRAGFMPLGDAARTILSLGMHCINNGFLTLPNR
ncbi:hypothetical protein F5X98DRAFT_230187 [Xylaria grammica]|nr:hypothetical protein F5X98DRAFT_230187 [Xylaria grammica]